MCKSLFPLTTIFYNNDETISVCEAVPAEECKQKGKRPWCCLWLGVKPSMLHVTQTLTQESSSQEGEIPDWSRHCVINTLIGVGTVLLKPWLVQALCFWWFVYTVVIGAQNELGVNCEAPIYWNPQGGHFRETMNQKDLSTRRLLFSCNT